jgi:hypothetical protein
MSRQGIDTEWDFVDATDEDIALIAEQQIDASPGELVVGVQTHAAFTIRQEEDEDPEHRWLLTARLVLKDTRCDLIRAAEFRADVPCTGTLTLIEAKAKWTQVLSTYLMDEWIPRYAQTGCDEE